MADYKDIAGRIRTSAADGVVAEAQEIKDLILNKNQQEVNADVQIELSNRYTKAETYSKEQLNSLITTPNEEYVTVPTFTDLPQIGEADTVYRVSSYDGIQVDASKYALYAWDGTSYQLLAVRSAVGEVFDVSEYNSGTPYETLTAALDAVPASVQRGGMSIKFVQSSDNKYVQWRLMSDAWSTTVTNWQGVDEEPTAQSHNLVESGSVYSDSQSIREEIGDFSKSIRHIIAYNGAWVKENDETSYLIPVKAGDIIHIVKDTSLGDYYCQFLKSYSDDDVSPDWANGYSGNGNTYNDATITAPSDAKYFYFTSVINGSNRMPSVVEVNGISIFTNYINYINNISPRLNNLESEIISIASNLPFVVNKKIDVTVDGSSVSLSDFGLQYTKGNAYKSFLNNTISMSATSYRGIFVDFDYSNKSFGNLYEDGIALNVQHVDNSKIRIPIVVFDNNLSTISYNISFYKYIESLENKAKKVNLLSVFPFVVNKKIDISVSGSAVTLSAFNIHYTSGNAYKAFQETTISMNSQSYRGIYLDFDFDNKTFGSLYEDGIALNVQHIDSSKVRIPVILFDSSLSVVNYNISWWKYITENLDNIRRINNRLKESLAIIGDSYSTYQGFLYDDEWVSYYPYAGNNVTAKDTYWYKLCTNWFRLAVNYSISGSTVTNLNTSRPSFVQRVQNIIKDRNFDTIIVFGATNDFWSTQAVELGQEKYADWNESDFMKVIPSYCYIFDTIQTYFPGTRIINVVNDLQALQTQALTELGKDGEEWEASIASVCSHYSVTNVQLRDISKVSGHPNIQGMQKIYQAILESI